jgi:hypothetical protein
MSNDYALFIIHLPDDFDNEIATIPAIPQPIKPIASSVSHLISFFLVINLSLKRHQSIQYRL